MDVSSIADAIFSLIKTYGNYFQMFFKTLSNRKCLFRCPAPLDAHQYCVIVFSRFILQSILLSSKANNNLSSIRQFFPGFNRKVTLRSHSTTYYLVAQWKLFDTFFQLKNFKNIAVLAISKIFLNYGHLSWFDSFN